MGFDPVASPGRFLSLPRPFPTNAESLWIRTSRQTASEYEPGPYYGKVIGRGRYSHR